MMGIGFPELMIILVIIMIIFGAGKLPEQTPRPSPIAKVCSPGRVSNPLAGPDKGAHHPVWPRWRGHYQTGACARTCALLVAAVCGLRGAV